MIFQQMRPDIIFHGREQRDLQAMRALEQRYARAVTLRDLRLFFFAHLMRIVELLEKFVRVLDSIDAEIQVVDILIAGPNAR